MLLVTAPSKTQQKIERDFKTFTLPEYIQQAEDLHSLLSGYSEQELAKLMKMSATLATTTRQKIQNFQPPMTLQNSCQAIFTFQGDAYAALQPANYTEAELQHAQEHIRILSGLYGILRPLDLIFPYRLEMATRLENSSGNNLYSFWKPLITENINRVLANHRDQTLVNLASAEYFKVIDRKKLCPQIVTIVFKEKKGEGYKTIPIHSKRARGMMLHYVITKRLSDSNDLRSFNLGGYTFSAEFSQENEWIFLR